MNLSELLTPLSPESPCGEDLTYSPEMLELDSLVQGKPETQFSAAEAPEWKVVQEKALALFGQTKDLRVTTYLALARLALAGLSGFAEGLTLLRQLLAQYWDTIYPPLDEDGDPLERTNILASLSATEPTYSFIQLLRQVPLCRSPRLGELTLAQVQAALDGTPDIPEGQTVDRGLVEATFRDTAPEFLAETAAAITRAQDELTGIDRFVTDAVGASRAANLEALERLLRNAERAIRPYLAASGSAAASPGLDVTPSAQPGGALTRPLSPSELHSTAASGFSLAEVRSRQDVLTALDAICRYYDQAEPSSPILPLLRRCQQMVGKSFLELLHELVPEAVAQVRIERGDAAERSDAA